MYPDHHLNHINQFCRLQQTCVPYNIGLLPTDLTNSACDTFAVIDRYRKLGEHAGSDN